jgi:tRNA(Ile)-lysidine synthetase-like protein
VEAASLEASVAAFAAERLPALGTLPCVLAVSGGADSTAMVALLIESGVVRPADAVVGHFDHRLRGDGAPQRDRAAVDALCARYGLTSAVETWAVPRAGEAAARDARYAGLACVAERHGAGAIVTGHTADDQAETVLMHTMRGAGLHGLAGMRADAPLPPDRGLRVWRPLLAVTRAQTRAYCDARRLAYHDDATNADRAFLRNRLRLDVLPAMERTAPGLRSSLVALAEASRVAADAVDRAADELLPAGHDSAQIGIDRGVLAAAPADLRLHVFRRAIIRLLGDARDLERRHYALLGAAAAAQTGARLALPRGLVVTVDADAIHLSRGPLDVCAVEPGLERDLPFAGVAGAWALRIAPAGEVPLADGGIELRLPDGAVLRARRSGDRVRTRAGGKKLGDWYTDRKIPVREREAAPVIAYGQQVLWTPWGALAELPHGRAWRVIARRSA